MDVKLTLRVPEDLHAKLVQRSEDDQRSLNGEIVWLLTQALRTADAKGTRR